MSILNNALSGALASQLALNASSQNIANLQTKGYTRQSALLSAVAPSTGSNQAGNGVAVTSLMRFSDDYKTQQLWRSASDLGAYSQQQPYLTQLEKVMGDDEASLSNGVDQFFAALNAVAGDPTSTPLRQQVITAGNLMAERFNSLNTVFSAQTASLDQQRSAIVDSANSDIATIAALNTQISQSSASGTNVSSLIDDRDQAIDRLSTKFALEVNVNPDGSRNVSLRGGQSLVLGSIAGKLAVSGSNPQKLQLTIATSTFTPDPIKVGGQFGGLSKYESETLRPLMENVGRMAFHISDRVNDVLSQGYVGGTAVPTAGTPMFTFNGNGGANMLKVTDGFQVADLALSADNTPGDTGNLAKLIAIKDLPLVQTNPASQSTELDGVRFADADTQLVGSLAVKSQQNKAALSTSTTVRNQADEDWQSTSGVNQDEEAVNLVEYQKMYQANMKVLSVANALFDATLAMMG
jgi:flagellar hook-associated protein 1 FlgK